MTARLFLLLLLATGAGRVQAESAVTTRLKAEFKSAYPYSPPAAPVEKPAVVSDEPVLHLETMVITDSPAFVVDILAEARRAAEAKEAAKFSLLRGGSFLDFKRGQLGFWPQIVPMDVPPLKRKDVMISVDLLRIKW